MAKDFTEAMERARMEAWQRISPHSNTHDSACDESCFRPEHYPEGDPLDGYGDPDETTELMRRFMKD